MSRFLIYPILALLFWALSGCSSMNPSLRVAFPPLVIPEGAQLTDRDIFNNVSAGEAICGDKAGRAQLATSTTALALRGLAAGAVIAATRGASGAALGAMAAGGSFLDDIFGIYRPDERLNAYDTCLDMVQAGKATYLKASDGTIKPGFTKDGSQLYEDYAHAQALVRSLIKGTMASPATLLRYLTLLQSVQAIPPQPKKETTNANPNPVPSGTSFIPAPPQ